MAGIKSMVVMVVLVVLASFQLQSTVAQTRHVVGDSIGIGLIPNHWCRSLHYMGRVQQTIQSCDTLYFFNSPRACIMSTNFQQSAYVPAAPRREFATFPDLNRDQRASHHHLKDSRKPLLHMCFWNSLSSWSKGSTPTPSDSTSPVPAGSPPSTPDATPPPSPSSASTLTAVVPAAFLAAALALVY
ncbi:hypothetical protein Tco_1266000 [Tanacetum coccineum]